MNWKVGTRSVLEGRCLHSDDVCGCPEVAGPSQDLVTLLQAAVAKIKDISGGTGDPHLRLEKYLVRHYERSSAQAEARTFFATLSKTYPTSVVVALARVDFEM